MLAKRTRISSFFWPTESSATLGRTTIVSPFAGGAATGAATASTVSLSSAREPMKDSSCFLPKRLLNDVHPEDMCRSLRPEIHAFLTFSPDRHRLEIEFRCVIV